MFKIFILSTLLFLSCMGRIFGQVAPFPNTSSWDVTYSTGSSGVAIIDDNSLMVTATSDLAVIVRIDSIDLSGFDSVYFKTGCYISDNSASIDMNLINNTVVTNLFSTSTAGADTLQINLTELTAGQSNISLKISFNADSGDIVMLQQMRLWEFMGPKFKTRIRRPSNIRDNLFYPCTPGNMIAINEVCGGNGLTIHDVFIRAYVVDSNTAIVDTLISNMMDSIPAGDSAIFSFDSPNTLAWGEYAINYYLHFSDSISDQCTDSEDTLVHTTYLGEFAIYNSSNPIPYLSYNIWVTDNITLGNAVVLGNGNELIARAGKSIEINPGVTIEPGSIADMRIQPCPEAPSAQRQGLSIVTSDNTSVEALTSDDSMKVHPNPFGNELFIEYNSSNYSPVSIRMYDMWGHEVRYIETQTEKGERLVGKIDVANLTPGVYIVAIYSGKVKRISCVAIKQ